MALGTFDIIIDGERIGEIPETTATLRVRIQGQDAVKDTDGRFKFPHESARKPINISLPYTLTLPTDATSGVSEMVGYEVDIDTDHGGRVRTAFPAQAAGSSTYLGELTEAVVIPIADSARYAQEAETAAGLAETYALDAETAAQSVYSIGTDNETAVAGALSNETGPARTVLNNAIDGRAPALTRPRLPHVGAALGDSIIYGGGVDPVTGTQEPRTIGMSWPIYAASAAGAGLRFAYYDGRPGKRMDECATGVPGVIASGAAWCFLGAPHNDMIQGRPEADIRATMVGIFDQLLTAGVLPVPQTLCPSGDATRRTKHVRYNSWLRHYCATRGIPVVDVYNLLVDPATGDYLAAYDNGDDVHPNIAGYRAMGVAAWAQIGKHFNNVPLALVSTMTDDANLLGGDCLFRTVPGTVGVPVGWGAYGASSGFTHSRVDAGDGSFWAQVDCVGSNSDRVLTRPVATGWAAGDRLSVAADVEVLSHGSGNGLTLQFAVSGVGGATRYPAYRWRTPGADRVHVEFVVPAGTTGLTMDFIAGAGTTSVRFKRPTVRNLTASGIA